MPLPLEHRSEHRPEHRPDDHWIETPRGRLFARRWGPVPNASATIVLFHDSLGCVELWRDFPERLALATGRTVVAFDRPGYGRSAPLADETGSTPLPVTFLHDEVVASIPALCEALNLTRIVPIGHSVGGGMAIETAATFADRCDALVTIAAQSMVEDRTLEGIRAEQAAFQEPGRLDRLRRYHGVKAPWVLAAWVDTWLSPTFADWQLDDVLPRVTCPTLVIHGAQDEYGSPVHAERITARCGGPTTTLVIPNCGHMPHREYSEQVTGAIAEFLLGA